MKARDGLGVGLVVASAVAPALAGTSSGAGKLPAPTSATALGDGVADRGRDNLACR